jgi:hypothetical protein
LAEFIFYEFTCGLEVIMADNSCSGGKHDELSFLDLERVELNIDGEWRLAVVIRQASPLNPIICLQPTRGATVEIDSRDAAAIERIRPEGSGLPERGLYVHLRAVG